MRLSYYDKFKCTADKCEITCCQEWKISVDDGTIDRWTEMGLSDCICEKDEEMVIKLNEARTCPFLSENKLCNLVINHGERVIPHTCDVFPRQIHEFDNRTEYALVSCCPEVINLLNEADINEMTKELFAEKKDFMYNLRNLLIKEIIKSDSVALGIKKGYFMLLDCLEKDRTSLDEYDDNYFEELNNAIAQVPVSYRDTLEEVNELFLDIVENYRKQGIYVRYLEGISNVAEELSQASVNDLLLNKYKEYLRNIDEYKDIFKKYMISELFADGLLPDSDTYELTVMLQWFSIEYSLIRHAVFLKTLLEKREVIFEDIVEYMVIISRIMGYNKEDIYEYMEECFEESIWEWGYLALIAG